MKTNDASDSSDTGCIFLRLDNFSRLPAITKDASHCKWKVYRELFEIHAKFEILLSKRVLEGAGQNELLNMSLLKMAANS